MISIRLMGGLGNVMFQIATIEYLGKAFNMEVCYTNVDAWLDDLKDNYFWSRHAEEYLTVFPNVNLYKNHDRRFIVKRRAEVVFRYRDLLPDDGDLFVAYFQSERNFGDRAFIENLFTPSQVIKDKVCSYDRLFDVTTCSINVRRCNYLNFEDIHPVCSLDYYMSAIEMMKSNGAERFIISTDDPNWCKNNFVGEQYVFTTEIDYIDMFLMARSTHHIISNSSFGWWGAWLGETRNTKVIAPKKWFGTFLPEGYSADIIPDRWIRL